MAAGGGLMHLFVCSEGCLGLEEGTKKHKTCNKKPGCLGYFLGMEYYPVICGL